MSHSQQQRVSPQKTLKWTSIKFLEHVPSDLTLLPARETRFCEAVSRAGEGEWILTADRVCCQGARRCFGWLKGANRELAWQLAERLGTTVAIAEKAISEIPVLPAGCEAVWVGTDTGPDVFVSYVLPETAMQIVRSWQRVFGTSLAIQVSGIMAVCGSAVVNSYVNQTISLTFGCPDSRQHGRIRPEQLVVAMPADPMGQLNDVIDDDILQAS
jgi:uncharacterized protein (DUF169 family)